MITPTSPAFTISPLSSHSPPLISPRCRFRIDRDPNWDKTIPQDCLEYCLWPPMFYVGWNFDHRFSRCWQGQPAQTPSQMSKIKTLIINQIKNHSICNLAIKDSLIYFERFIQLFLSLPLSALLIVLLGEWNSLRWCISDNTCFFLKLLTSFLDRESYILPIVSYIPPNSFIFLAIMSVCLSKYSLVLIVEPLGCSKKISCVLR